MKKMIVVGLALSMMLSAYADTMGIDWRAWMFDHDATDLTDDSGDVGILNNYDVLWQLIHTESGTPGLPDLTAEDYLGPGEYLLTEPRLFSNTSSGVFDMSLYPTSQELSEVTIDKSVSSFYIYQRIYELEQGTTIPVEGTYYYDSEVIDLVQCDEWESGTPLVITAAGNAALDYGTKPNQQIPYSQSVPEPATMGLLGLGALVLGLRRKLRK